MALFRRARPSAEVPAHPFHDTTVSGHPVRVHEMPWSVCAYLDGRILQPVIAARPRERPEPDARLHPGASMMLTVLTERPHEAPTGDPAFDARYVVNGPTGLQPAFTFTEPVRAALMAHDVALVLAHANGAWVAVGHDAPAAQAAAEATALQILGMLVRA